MSAECRVVVATSLLTDLTIPHPQSISSEKGNFINLKLRQVALGSDLLFLQSAASGSIDEQCSSRRNSP